YLCINDITHIIHARGLTCQKFSRLHSALAKHCLGISRMGKGNYLVCSGKNHIMVAYNRTAANGTDSDFLFASFFPSAAPLIELIVFIVKFFIYRIRQCECSTAWWIPLEVMMLLHDFYIKARRSNHACRLLQKLDQKIDTEGHTC